MSAELQMAVKPAAGLGRGFAGLQRKCACGEAAREGECEECKKGASLQRLANGGGTGTAIAPPVVHEVLRSPGQPLDATTRTYLESRFHHHFGNVRFHSDAQAAKSARVVNAAAYTVGPNIVFGVGQFLWGTSRGRRLIAHELSHVVQQGAQTEGPLILNEPGDPDEREGNHPAEQVAKIGGLSRESNIQLNLSHRKTSGLPQRDNREPLRDAPAPISMTEQFPNGRTPPMSLAEFDRIHAGPAARHGHMSRYPRFSRSAVDSIRARVPNQAALERRRETARDVTRSLHTAVVRV